MLQKDNNYNNKLYRIIIIGQSPHPVHTMVCNSYSIRGEMVIWEDLIDKNRKSYHVKSGEQVDVVTIN